MRWRRGYILQPAAERAPAPVLQVERAHANPYSTTIRLTSTTPASQEILFFSGVNGSLESVTVFTDNVDTGDTWSLFLQSKTLKENVFPVANTAIKDDFNIDIQAGDRLRLLYNSKGATTKNIDMTPHLRY